MRLLPVILLTLLLPVAWAAGPAGVAPLQGKVLETMDAGPYTYLRLQTGNGETWAAVPKAAVQKGQQVTIQGPMTMTQFESRTLNRTFDTIVFGSLAGAGAAVSEQELLAAHAGAAKGGEVEVGQVLKATGPQGRTVAEVIGQRAQLAGKTVAVRGKVVKFSPGIMDRNWLHVRDGSGSTASKNDDLLVTTQQTVAVGDLVLVRGTVRTDQDFGAGYTYDVLVENATLGK
jgi:hypothetical protein